MEVGTIIKFDEGFVSNSDMVKTVTGSKELSGMYGKIIEVDSSDMPYGVHLWHNNTWVGNYNGVHTNFWFTENEISQSTIITDTTLLNEFRRFVRVPYHSSFGEPAINAYSGELGNHYISFTGYNGAYMHDDGFIYNGTRTPFNEWNGYFDNIPQCENAFELFKCNILLKGIPQISSIVNGRIFVSLEGNGTIYLHNDGVFKTGAGLHARTSAWYDNEIQAQTVIDEYMRKANARNGFTMSDIGSILDNMDAIPSQIFNYDRIKPYTVFNTSTVEFKTHTPDKEYYVTFTHDQLKNYNFTKFNAEHLMINIDAPSEEQVRKELASEFGEGRVCFNIYEGRDARNLLIDNLEYSTYTMGALSKYKLPDVPENYTKELYIHEDLAQALRNINDGFSELLRTSTYIGSNVYKVKATNAFNSSNEKLVTQEGHKITSNKQDLRLGRVIKAFAGHLFTDLDIEAIVSSFKVKYEVDTSVVQVSDNVADIYTFDECGSSCMANQPSSWFDIYEDMRSRIVYIKDGYDLKARALLHTVIDIHSGDEYEVLDRIFYDDEKSKLTIQQWRREQKNITRMSYHEGVSFRGKYPVNHSYDGVPYVDNLCYAQDIDGEIYLCNSRNHGSNYDYLQETGGESENGNISEGGGNKTYCYDTENYVDSDDVYYCETNGEFYENEDNLVYIGGSYYNSDDDRVTYDENRSEYADIDDLKYCESEGIYTSSDSYIYVTVGDREGSYEPDDECIVTEDEETVLEHEARYIEDMGYWLYNTEDCFEHDDGKWYSYEEVELEEDEDTEEVA